MCLGETVRRGERRGSLEPWVNHPPSPTSHSLLSWWLTAGTRGNLGGMNCESSRLAAAVLLQLVLLCRTAFGEISGRFGQRIGLSTLAAARIKLEVFRPCAGIYKFSWNSVLTTSQQVSTWQDFHFGYLYQPWQESYCSVFTWRSHLASLILWWQFLHIFWYFEKQNHLTGK